MDWKVRALTLVLWLGLVLTSIQNGNAEKRVVCYYTNWSVYRPGTAKFSPQNINPYLCTHLIYAFGGFTKDNTLKPFDKYQDIEKGGYAKFTGLKTYNKNLKTLLAIGGWNEGSSRFSPMVADAHRRKEFVKNCVKFLRQNHFDGLDLDWEYPAFRDGGKPHDKENYATLVEELREQFDRESLKTGRPRLLLTLAMPAGIKYIDKGYDVPRLNENLDFINLLSYDYHSAFEPAVNHHAPLYPLEEDNEYNYDTELTIEYTINHLVKAGASSDKIVLGIPTYGRSYTLFNEDSTDIGSPADGPGIEGDATREKGYLAYYEICENVEKKDWEVIQPNPEAMGPYAFKGNQWVGYDDENIVRAKAQYVNEKNLGGIMFWSIDNDDFRGNCHGRPYPLIEAAKEALFAGNSKRKEVNEKPSFKKPSRIQSNQSNSSGRQYATSNRRATTTEPATRRRLGSSKPKNKSNARVAEDEDEEETAVLEEEEEEEEEENNRNTVKVSEKPTRSRLSNKNRTRIRSTESTSRRKQKNRENKPAEDSNGEESLSKKLTTPEPPTTPDPGSDFKCEDEGFFPHPRDCKKYFWCLDSGPSGLGVVAHQFTCPSGLVFNKGADSCDYPRNVVCPKVKSGGEATTTKAPTTAATTRSTTRRTTTEKQEPEEEYEYEDEEEEEEEEEEKAPKTTAKPLLYKTISRNRSSSTTKPSTTTTTTTTTAKTHQEAYEKSLDFEEEEDPRVIKELIDLIKKAGGIDHLEKQLLLQEKHVGGKAATTVGSGQVTPATISRSLYERVLNRQASKVSSKFFGSSSPKPPENKDDEGKEGNKRSRTGYTNGPGRSQFDGLDDLPEVKSLRRTNKPQYTTIERSRSSPFERIDESEDEEESDDNTNVASSEERSISNPPDDKSLLPRVTPSYVNIRRHRPTTTSKDDNDLSINEEELEEDKPTRRRFPLTSTRTEKSILDKEDSKPQRYRLSKPKNSTTVDQADKVQSPTESEPSSKRTVFPNKNVDESSTSKSRYISIQRFRSTTEKPESKQSEDQEAVTNSEVTTQTTQNTSFKDTTTSVSGSSEIPYTVSMTYSQSSSSSSSLSTSPLTTTSTTTTTTETPTPQYTTLNEEPTSSTKTTNPTRSSFSSVKLVEDSATEILLTTSPFTSPPTISTESTTKETIAAVFQPRPFGFTRGKPRPSLTQTSSFLDSTTPLSSFATVPSRSKVSTTSRNFARSTNTYQTRGRARSRATTESSSRVFSERFNEDIEDQEVSTQASRPRGRSRGFSRYARPTASSAVEEISSNSVSRTRAKVTTIPPNDATIQPSRRGRRPTSKSNIGRGSRNDLDDSPIIRISQEVPQRSQTVGRSRRPSKSFDEATAQITNIRVFKESERAAPRTKTRQRSRFEDSTAQASIPDLSETTSTSRLEEETFFAPSSSYSFAKTTGSYLKSTQGNEDITDWTGLNSIHPYYSTDLGVNTVTFPSITTEPVKSRNYSRKFKSTYNELSRSSTTEPPSSRKRILLIRRRPGADTTTAASEDETRNQRRRKVIRKLRPVEERSTSTELYRDQEQKIFRSRYFERSTTPKARTDKIQTVVSSDNPSTLNENSFFGSYTTEPIPTNSDATTFSNEFNLDSTEAFQTTFLDSTTESGLTDPIIEDYPKYYTKPTTDYDTSQTTLPTTVIILPEHLTTLVELVNNKTSLFRTSRVSSTLETTTPISLKITESQSTPQKFSRKLPQPTTITNARHFPVSSTSSLSTTTEVQPEALVKRRKSLFIRRRPSTRTQFEPKKNSFDDREDSRKEVSRQEDFHNDPDDDAPINPINDDNPNKSSSIVVPDEFWKSFTTQSLNTDNNEKVGPVYRRPEYRPILRTISKTPDSFPQESGDELETNNPSNIARSTLSIYRKPRVRFQNKELNLEDNDGSTQTKNRFFPKRTTTTEQSVTETLIPAKKFDYAADAYLRKQQSQRPRSKNEEIELQNLVDVYSTTPSSKPQITRLVTSVVESATTERQRILIRKKYSQLTSTTFIPVQTTTSRYERPTPTSFSLKSEKKSKENLDSTNDESLSEASTELGIEKSTLPIESAFLKNGGIFTTESTGESSTIEIESVASSESFQLPTLKQLIGHQSDSTFNNEEGSVNVTQPSLTSSLSFPIKENLLRRSFDKQEVVDIPIQILDDNDDDPDKLLLLRAPQSKLNRTILHTVLNIKVVDPNNLEKDDDLEFKEDVSNTNLLSNELLMKKRRVLNEVKQISISEKSLELERSASTYRGRSNRKRRIRVDLSLSANTEDSIASQSTLVQKTETIVSTPVKLSTKEQIIQTTENVTTQYTRVIQNTESNLPANPRAADIERARRRRIRINSSQVTSGPISDNRNTLVRGRPSRRRNRVQVPETTTIVSVTTSRGTTLPGTTLDFPRGFLLTRNIDDILVTRVDKLSTVGIQSVDPSTLFTTENNVFSTKPFTNSPTTTEYSELSTIANSPLIEDANQDGEFNFFVTTTEIAQENEDYNQPMETTTEISETIIPKLEDDENDMNTSTGETTTEQASSLPDHYIKRKKIRKIKPVSSPEFSNLESFRSLNEEKNILLKKTLSEFALEETTDSSFTNPDSIFTTLDSISFTTSTAASSTPGSTASPTTFTNFDAKSSVPFSSISLSITSDPTFESTFFTTETPTKEQSTVSENLTAKEEPDLKLPEITEASDFALTTEYILQGTEDFIKFNSNFVESITERHDSFTTKLYVQEQTNSYDDFEKLKLESKEAEIRGNDITTEKGDLNLSTLSQVLNTETTPMSINQIQNETTTSVAKSSSTNTSIANDTSSLIKTNDQISTESPLKITKKVVDELFFTSNRPTNSRRRVLKRKRQRNDPKPEEKSMEVAKTETIVVTLEKEENPTTPASISSSSTAPESEKPTRKRVVVYRGNRRFSSRTTPSTVQSSPDTRDQPNQIASRRRTKKVVRKRPKLSSADSLESDLSTPNDESNRKGKHLSLDSETKSYDDADQAGSELNEKSVNIYRSSPPASKRQGPVYHREQNRIKSRASTYQPTTLQPTSRRFSNPSVGRQSLYFEKTTLPPKIRFASVDDAVLRENLARVEDQKAENDDQANRAHEVMIEDPETTPSSTEPGYSSLKKAFWRKISTTETPKTLATTAVPAFRRRQGQKYYSGVVSQNLPQRPRRPAIVDYDYYEDEEVRFVGKPILNGKLYVTSRGSINCLDQGNFPHPTSCKKFITCARMVNGLVVGTEYTCPDKLSFDPIGGICNWSAGLGCKE